MRAGLVANAVVDEVESMRSLILLILLLAVLATGGIVINLWMNHLPWGDPPGRWVRLRTYLTEHVAQTAEESAWPELRPRRYPGVTPDQLFAAVDRAVATLGWAVLQRAAAERVLRTVVTSPILHLQDDVEIAVTAGKGEAILNARAVARMGQGDLGNDAGHLLRLYAAVQDALAHQAPGR